MIEHALRILLLQTLALAIATGVVRLLQASVLRRLGAAARYLGWLLVPVAMLAVALPHPAADTLSIHVDVAAIAPAWAAMAPATMEAATPSWAVVVMAAWAGGAALLALVLWARQRGFEALVGPSPDSGEPGLPAGAGPAVLGVWRRRIVLPQDFDCAFDVEERRLMLLHEGVHLRRADNAWNLLAAVLLVLHWFNPVAWWAWRCLRADQETSCDADVLRQEPPGALAVYAAALLKVQGVALAPPLATSWQSAHPLVERVRMLQRHRISSARHRAGLRVVVLSLLLAGSGGYALRAGASGSAEATPVEGAYVMTAVQVRADGGPTWSTSGSLHLLTRVGEPALLRLEASTVAGLAAPLEIAFTASRLDADRVQIDTTLRSGSPLATLASPRLITHDGEAAHISVRTEDGAHEVAVSFKPKVLTEALPTLRPLPPVPPVSALAPLPPVPATDALPPLPAPLAPSALPPLPAPRAPAALPPLPAVPPPPVQRAS